MRAAQLAMPLLRHLLPTLYMTQWRPLMLQHVQTMPASCSASTAFALLQRRRNTEDELNMRAVYQEGDLISVSLCSASAVPQVTALPHKSSSKQAALPMLIQHDATVTPKKAKWRLSQERHGLAGALSSGSAVPPSCPLHCAGLHACRQRSSPSMLMAALPCTPGAPSMGR